jgi:drug/metabolite transporter (DMT)-like permease
MTQPQAVAGRGADGRTARADLSVLLVAVIWGSSYVVMQDVGKQLPTGAFLALRFLTAVPVMLLLAAPTLRRITAAEVRTGAFFGGLLFGILMFETSGVRHTSAANAGFLISTSVVLVPVFERVLSRRRQPAVIYIATIAALGGCGMLTLSEGLRPRSGDLIILAAALIRAFQITLFGHRPGGAQQSLVHVTVVELIMVMLLATVSSVIVRQPVWSAAVTTGPHSWLLIAYLGVLGTAYAFFVQLRMARTASSTRVGIILCTEPVFAAIFAVTLAGERLGLVQMIGGLLVVAAAFAGRAAEGRPVPPRLYSSGSKAERDEVDGGVRVVPHHRRRRRGHRGAGAGAAAGPPPVGGRARPAGGHQQGYGLEPGVGRR